MRRILILAIALLVLASAANAENLVNWTGRLTPLAPESQGWIAVTVNATLTAGLWDWTYDLKPTGVDATHTAFDIESFSLSVGAPALAPIDDITSSNAAVKWSWYKTGSSIVWTVPPGTILAAGSTGRFEFTSKWGPSVDSMGYAMDHGPYAGLVPTPTIPEPMSVLLGIMWLSSIAVFGKLRRK